MPAGVHVTVADGFATIDFVDPAKRGPGLSALLKVGGPEMVETLTREGPRRLYRVPEGNAREAGLIDGAAAAGPAEPETRSDTPDSGWSRAELNEYAADVGIDLPEKMRTKDDVLDAIRQAEGADVDSVP